MQIPKPPKNYNSQSPIESLTTTSKKQSTMIHIIVIIILCFAIIFICYLIFSNPWSPFMDQTKITQRYTGKPSNLPNTSPTPVGQTLTEVPGEITWINPQEITPTGLLSVFDTLYQPTVTISSQGEATAPPKYFKVGIWKSGEYKNGDVIDVQIPSPGEGSYNIIVQATTLNNSLIIFTKDVYLKGYNSETNSFAGSKLYDPKIKPDNRYLPGLHIPDYTGLSKEVYYPINDVDFHPLVTGDFTDLTGYKFLTTFYKGQKAYAKDQSTPTFSWDNLESVYAGSNLDNTLIFLSERRDILDSLGKTKPNWIKQPLEFSNGNDNMPYSDFSYFDYFSAGCTRKSITTFAGNAQFNPQDLELVLSSSENSFYIPTKADSILQALYEPAKINYKSHTQTAKELSYDDFVKGFPILIWKDKLGFYQILYRTDFVGYGCGKPVIYLYPTKKTDVSVRFGTDMKLTKTEPLYKNGWNVIAYPDGKLVNKIDLKTYPNLFWEGSSNLNLKQEEKGSVVKKENVKDFLDKTLSAYGLNNQEKQDFISFWLPRLQGKPYYKITFHTTNDINTFVPLLISPQPDSILRLLMEYHGLGKNDLSIPQSPIPFIRKGFTVVEWGGIFGN